jgi:hypothetical protein
MQPIKGKSSSLNFHPWATDNKQEKFIEEDGACWRFVKPWVDRDSEVIE